MTETNRAAESRAHGRNRLTLLGLGALLALLGHLAQGVRARGTATGSEERRVQYWAADRDGDHVFGLDADLILRTRIGVRRPLRVLGRIDGGAWILHAHGRRDEPHGLKRVDEWGVVQASTSTGEVLDLSLLEGRDLVLLERGAPARGSGASRDPVGDTLVKLVRIDAQGRRRTLLQETGLAALAVSGEELLLGRRDGGLLRVSAEGIPRGGWSFACPGEVPLALAPVVSSAVGQKALGWWMLGDGGQRRLTRLDGDSNPLWSTSVDLDARVLVPCSDPGEVWLADNSQPQLHQYGRKGRLLRRREVSLAGLGRGTLTPGGSFLWTVPGALLHLDRRGDSRPGQGGFEFLTDVSSVPERQGGVLRGK